MARQKKKRSKKFKAKAKERNSTEYWKSHDIYDCNRLSFGVVVTRSQTAFSRIKNDDTDMELFCDAQSHSLPHKRHLLVILKGKYGSIPRTIITRSTTMHLKISKELCRQVDEYKDLDLKKRLIRELKEYQRKFVTLIRPHDEPQPKEETAKHEDPEPMEDTETHDEPQSMEKAAKHEEPKPMEETTTHDEPQSMEKTAKHEESKPMEETANHDKQKTQDQQQPVGATNNEHEPMEIAETHDQQQPVKETATNNDHKPMEFSVSHDQKQPAEGTATNNDKQQPMKETATPADQPKPITKQGRLQQINDADDYYSEHRISIAQQDEDKPSGAKGPVQGYQGFQ